MILTESAADIPTPTGPMRTHVYRPKDARRFPAVLFFSEIFQRTGPIGRMAAFLAGHGYVVLVPEIFHELETPGAVLAYDQAGSDRGNADKRGKPIEAFDSDIAAAIGWLGVDPGVTGHVGAFGVCVGGHLAFRAALHPRVRASVCAYATDLHQGSLGTHGDDSLRRASDITGDLLLVWGRQDPHVPLAGRRIIQARLEEVGVGYTWHELNAQHAFMRDEGPRYDPALAATVNRLALDLFARALAG